MSKQDILFVINPNSGTDRKKSTLEKNIDLYLSKDNYNPIIRYTERPQHATQIVKSFLKEGIEEIVAVGGDGTINEIASQLIHTKTVLNLISKGSGNGLARHLGIFNDEKTCIQRINLGKIIEIDTGLINDIPFLCTAGIGFDALAAENFSKIAGRGFKNYVRAGLGSYFNFEPLKIKFNNSDYKIFSISFGNASQFGNNAYITPEASISDGLLDCCIIKDHPKLQGLNLAQKLFRKKIKESKFVEYYREKTFNLLTEDKALIHYDGEPKWLDTNKIKISIREKSLRIKI